MKSLNLSGVIVPVALICLLNGCAKPLTADPATLARQREHLYKFQDREVTLIGDAGSVDTEAYCGSAVILDDATQIRVPEIKSWPRSARSGSITIRGVLRRYTPTGTRGASRDEWFTLEGVRWQKGDLAPGS